MQKAIELIKHHKNKLVLAKVSALQVLVSFATNILILRSVGLGNELDVFYIAMAVFFFLCSSVNWSVASVLVPYLVKNRGQKKEGALFVTTTIITTPIAVLLYLTTPLWIDILYANYIDKVEYETILFIQELFIVIYILESLSLTFNAILQERNRYIWLNLTLLLSSVTGFIFVLMSLDTLGVYAAVWNQFIMKSILLTSLIIVGINPIVQSLCYDKDQLIEIFKKSKFILLGSLYFKTEELVERYIASYLTSGFISLLAFVQRVYAAIVTVINAAIGIPSITVFSNHINEGDYTTVKNALFKYISTLVIISTLIFIFMFFFGEYLLLQLMGNAISDELKPVLNVALLSMCVFLLTKTVSQVNQSLLLALEKGSMATLYDSITFTINVCLKVYATYTWGMYGLLASLIASYLITDIAKFSLVIRELNCKINSKPK